MQRKTRTGCGVRSLAGGVVLGLALALPTGTLHAQDQEGASPDGTRPVAADDVDSVWVYLLGKYDADGDGQISRAEYDRGDEAFARLDADENGALTEADFPETAGRGPGGMRGDMIAPMVLMRYFDGDEGEAELTREEVELAYATFDANEDGRVSRREFDLRLEERGDAGRMMGMEIDRFSSLLEVADSNDDLNLGLEELLAWFDERDTDANGVWTQGGRRGPDTSAPRGRPERGDRPGRGGRRDGRGRGEDGAREDDDVEVDPSPSAEGKVAPDFQLVSPHGGDPVTLSSFKKEKPVALIFGSYT